MLRSVLAEPEASRVRVFVYVDNGDRASFDRFRKEKAFASVAFELLESQHRAFGVWNRHLREHPESSMMYVCDDIEIQPNCLRVVLEKLEATTDRVIGLHQVNFTGRKESGFSRSAMGVIGRRFADRFPDRQCFCPDYTSFHADSELGKYARKVGRFLFMGDAQIVHHHPNLEPREIDETHHVVRQASGRDRERWRERTERALIWGESFERVAS
jgi:hypothetical protein